VQATWGSSEIRFDHVALIVAAFSVLAIVSVLLYLVFELAGYAAMQPALSDIPPGLRAIFPL
jgi:hypothetical protein